MVVPVEYSDFHRALLQALINHGTIKHTVFEAIFKKLNAKFHPEQLQIDVVIEMINEKISPFDQKITKYEYGLTDEVFYVFHSTTVTAASKLQATFTEDEIDYFKNILLKITENENLTITPLNALNLSDELPGKINKTRAEKLLEMWIQCHYFLKHNNQIHLGAKLLSEFKELLQSFELDYLKSCLLCESVAVWGDRCRSCSTIFHPSCLRQFLSRSKNCPSCKEKWEVLADN